MVKWWVEAGAARRTEAVGLYPLSQANHRSGPALANVELSVDRDDPIEQTALEIALWTTELNDCVYAYDENEGWPGPAATSNSLRPEPDADDDASAELERALWANALNDAVHVEYPPFGGAESGGEAELTVSDLIMA